MDMPEMIPAIGISIHALRVEGDGRQRAGISWAASFLSTPSGWRATAQTAATNAGTSDFYPRPPGGGRLKYDIVSPPLPDISIHALRVEGDVQLRRERRHGGRRHFYPRPPGGGRHNGVTFWRNGDISIHALRVEGDHSTRRSVPGQAEFLSTPSGWRATRS